MIEISANGMEAAIDGSADPRDADAIGNLVRDSNTNGLSKPKVGL